MSGVENRRSGFSLPVACDCAFASSPQSGLTWLCFLFPLIEPDRRISRIRLSEKTHTDLSRHVTPSATSEHNPGCLDLWSIPMSCVASCVGLLTEVPSLHRSYPASLVVRTSPPPHVARPDSREVLVGYDSNHH